MQGYPMLFLRLKEIINLQQMKFSSDIFRMPVLIRYSIYEKIN